MITFRFSKHNLTGREMVDIFEDGRFVAALYDDDSQPGVLKFISSHLDHVQVNSGPKLRVTGIPIIRFFFMDE